MALLIVGFVIGFPLGAMLGVRVTREYRRRWREAMDLCIRLDEADGRLRLKLSPSLYRTLHEHTKRRRAASKGR